MPAPIPLYQGTALLNKEASKKYGLDTYLPSPNLVKAVQLAQLLKRPLLIKGEPGCGKSRLAEAVAAELFGENFRDYYFEWHVKSSSKAQHGLYSINHLQRLSDANIKSDNAKNLEISLDKDANGNYNSRGKYIELGALGQAFQLSNQPGLISAPVVLIDEVDKADIDFPNDLLLELDRMEFSIPEAKDADGNTITIRANKEFRPLFIITSNDEKPLPPAFLRRCMFHYIDFEEIQLPEIVKSNYADLTDALIKDSVTNFKYWRKKIAERGTSNKNISTSELLDWIKLINFYTPLGTEKINMEEDGVPIYHQALLKDVESIQIFAKKDTMDKPA
ncbi:MAG: MoxR family ATPase [Ferruginibacter sp.]|nr:MoxR family ATPase [Ferruginibacter sp.]